MRVYADTSFLVNLLTLEAHSTHVVDEYQRLKRPSLFFLPIHELEVHNAIRHRVYHLTRSAPPTERVAIRRERDAALGRLAIFLNRRAFLPVASEIETAFSLAVSIAETNTEKFGCRSYDLLHIAFALQLKCELFLTCDEVQAKVARAQNLRVGFIKPA